jgi:hypothetical protein
MAREGACSTLDGNAAGGLLREVFAFEATAARATCAGCARVAPIGELRLYAVELGAVLRCPSCDETLIRIGRTPRGLWLDLRGAATIVGMSAGEPWASSQQAQLGTPGR